MQFGVSESIAHWAKYRPGAIAISHNGTTVSYREFNSLANKIARAMAERCIAQNRIAIAINSKYYFLAALIGILRSGKSCVLLNTKLQDDPLRINLSDAQVEAIIHDVDNVRIASFCAIKPTAISLSELLNSESAYATDSFPVVDGHNEWGVFYSSGTTGSPKGIERDHISIITELVGWCLELGLNRKTKFYIGRPVFYTGGLVLSLATMITCGTVVVNDYASDNDCDEVWLDYQNALKVHDIDWSFFIPDQLRHFSAIASGAHSFLRAHNILVMGAPISGSEKVRIRKVLGSSIVESWGNSESLGTITDAEDVDLRPDSVGRPFLTDEMCIVGTDLKPVGPRELGRIAGSEEAGFQQYCGKPEATTSVKQNEMIISEDIGYTDEDGYFYVCGRVQDCVEMDGTTIFVPSVEAKLRNNCGLLNFAVVPFSSEDSPVILVALRSGVPISSEDETLVLTEMNRHLIPAERISRLIHVEELPTVPSGKIDKIALQSIVAARLVAPKQ